MLKQLTIGILEYILKLVVFGVIYQLTIEILGHILGVKHQLTVETLGHILG